MTHNPIMGNEPIMSIEELSSFFAAEFPQINHGGDFYRISAVGPGRAEFEFTPHDQHLRPGGTVAGPALFALADVVAYAVILAHAGPDATQAVTTNLNINFLKRPAPGGTLKAAGHLLKLGRRLAVVECSIAEAGGTLVAHATATYAMPPSGK